MFKLSILLIIFSVVGSEDFNELLPTLPKSGSRIESSIASNWLENETMIINFYPTNSNQPLDNPLKLPEQCRKNSDCFALPYFVCSLGKCDCSQNYILSDGKCRGLLEEDCEYHFDCFPRDSVCVSGTCQCPATHYSKNGNCSKTIAKLYGSCDSNDQCKVPYSECAKGKCKCKIGYIPHDNVCYGVKNSACNNSTDCALLSYACDADKICTLLVRNYEEDELFSLKPGATAVFGPHLWANPEFHDYHLGEPGHNPGPEKTGNLHWVKNFTLDRVALFSGWNPNEYPPFVYVWCRAKTNAGYFTSGKMRIPGNGLCEVDYNGDHFWTNDWDVLVDLGPVN